MAGRSRTKGSFELNLVTGMCVVTDEHERVVEEAVVDIEDLRCAYESQARARAWQRQPSEAVGLLLTWPSGRCESLDASGEVVGRSVVDVSDLRHEFESEVWGRVRNSRIWLEFKLLGGL